MHADFNPAALEVIDFLNGDRATGKCFCPCHDDGAKPSLQVNNGDTVPVLIQCWGRKSREHNLEVIAHLKANGKWPTSDALSGDQSSEQVERARSPEERRRYALGIWKELRELKKQRDLTPLLKNYLQQRAIKNVPTTALVTVPIAYPEADVYSDAAGMVLAVRNKEGKFRGIHVVWLNGDMTAKREAEPQRQSYGPIKGNFVHLTEMDWANPPPKLLIAEGPETALSGMQLTGLPGIASAGAGMMKDLDPPQCTEYIILADNGEAGQEGATALARRLIDTVPGCTVRIATPERPKDGKPGYDWNDALVDCVAPGMEALHRDAILGAPVFTAPKDDKQVIDKLAKVTDPIEYDRETKKASAELKVTRTAVKEAVTKRRGELAKAAAAPVKPDMKKLAASARKIIASEDVLALFAKKIGRQIVGEENTTKILYLVGTSRLFDKTMHAAVKGPSAGGKSETRKRVLDFFPSEHVVPFTAWSEKALLYMRDGFEHKILSMGEAFTGKQVEFQDMLLRELMSDGKLRYPVVQKNAAGQLETTTVEKDGPVAFMVTTTRNKLNPENETRMLSLEIDDTKEQTKAVISKVAEVVGLNREARADDLRRWHDYQRWLAAGECRVFIPFAGTLADLIENTKSERLRRDFGQLLVAIKAHALLHRKHRKRSTKGSIVASIGKDYAAVRELMGDLLATASEVKTKKAIEQTVAVVGVVAQRRADPNTEGATVREIAAELNLDRSAAQRRLKAAEGEGCIANLEERKGHPARYLVTDDWRRRRDAGEHVGQELLPTPAALRSAYQVQRQAPKSEKVAHDPPETPAQVAQVGSKR